MESRDTVNYLKGVAILSVYVNHYVLMVINPASKFTYSNGIISLFFVLSGYGIWYSLDRVKLDAARLREFYVKRALRIFPLYWLTTYVTDRLDGTFSLLRYLALAPFPESRIYWFVSFILQCYLVSPLMYLLIKRRGVWTSLGACLALMGLVTFVYNHFGIPYEARYLAYRDFPLGHIFLFFLGMMLPALVSMDRSRLADHRATLPLVGLAYLLFVVFTERNLINYLNEAYELPFGHLLRIVALFLVLSSAAVVYIAINGRDYELLPLKPFMAFLGKHSYANYLFHVPFFFLANYLAVHLFFKHRIVDIKMWTTVFMLILTPAFFLFCMYIEWISTCLTQMLYRKSSKPTKVW